MADQITNQNVQLNQQLTEDAQKAQQETAWFKNKATGAQFEVVGRDTIERLKNDDTVEELNAAPSNVQTGGIQQIQQDNQTTAQATDNMAEFAEEYNINVVPQNLQTPDGQTAQKRARKSAKLSSETLNSTQE